jgi:hypothetical protein
MALSYNPDRNEFLYIWRNASPNTIRGRYLDTNGNPLGTEFAVGNGKEPHLAYSTGSERYVVTFAQSGGTVTYKVIDGDSTAPTPILHTGTISSANALADQIEYGSVSNKFLVTYVRDFAPNPRRADLFGRFISGDGMSLESEFGINTANSDQTGPTLAYSSGDDRWVVGYQSWESNPPDLNVAVIAPNKDITRQFKVAKTGAWEVVGAIAYNEVTGTFVFGWRHASNALTDGRAQEWSVSDGGASAVGPLITLSDDEPGVQAAAARTDAVDPQVTVLWIRGNGLDGVHAGIIHVSPPPPDLTPPAAVTDLAGSTGGPDVMIDPVMAVDATDELGAHPMGDSTDGNLTSYWGTSNDNTLETETITWDLGSMRNAASVVLWSRPSGNLFPEDYDIELSPDGGAFQTVFSMAGAVVPPGTSITHDFPPMMAQFVRLKITKPRQTGGGDYKVQLAEAQIFEADPTAGLITVTFTAPGDDDDVGAADFYDLRWSLSAINDGNFNAATPVAGLPQPNLAGNTETFQVSGLPDEDAVFLALKTEDEAGNRSAISNLPPPVNTPGIPPAPVNDLMAMTPGGDSANLTWTATGDDGMVGTASSYDLRWATFPIDDTNFDSANMIAVPFSPGAPGFGESLMVSGLPAETMVYFGIKVLDELMNASTADTTPTEPTVTTLDLMSPGPITDLREAPGGGMPQHVVAPASDSSGQSASNKSHANATDDVEATYWETPLRAPQNEHITVDTTAVHNIVQVKLLSRVGGSFFPEDVEIQVSNLPMSGFSTVASFSGLPATQGTWHTLDIPPSSGQYVKILITKARVNGQGDAKVQIAEIEIYESTIAFGEINLLWTAPGDNGAMGQAQSYDLRWSEIPITAGNFATRTPFALPAPNVGGSAEMATVTGLPNEKMIYFAMTSTDEVPLTSLISNVATATTAGIAPAAVFDFAGSPVGCIAPTDCRTDLTWSATGDDGMTGTADHYDIRVSTAPITEANFDSATPVSGVVPVPLAPMTPQMMTVTGLDDGTMYYFGMKVIDDVGNASTLQTNGVVSATTPDITPPASVTMLVAGAASPVLILEAAPAVDSSGELKATRSKEKATDGNATSYWNSPKSNTQQDEFITLDLGAAKTLSRVRLLSRPSGGLFPEDVHVQVSDTVDSGFFTVLDALGLPDTPATWHTLDFPAVSAQFVKIFISSTRATGTGQYQARIAEIEVYSSDAAGSVNLTWPSPGDDPGIGAPTSYDVRFSGAAINGGNFGAATELDGEPVPQSFGLQESFTVPAPEEGATVHFALTASDELGNTSLVSNDAVFVTTITAPSNVLDLEATMVTSLTARLAWTATGDDGNVGTATSYDIRVSMAPINAGNFDAATPVSGVAPIPLAPGTPQSMTVTGLNPSTPYHFAMKVEDETGMPAGTSAISNGIMVTTDPPDVVAPSAITDLRGSTPVSLTLVNAPAVDASSEISAAKGMGSATDGNPETFWGTGASALMQPEWITLDLGVSRTVSRVGMQSTSTSILFPEDVEVQVSEMIGSGFVTVHQEIGLPDTKGVWHTLDFTPATGRYVRINLTKLREAGGTFKARIAEIEVYESESLAGPISLAFTAPGDDLGLGSASSYDVRWSQSPIDAGNFNGANPLDVASPSEVGTIESIVIAGLPTGGNIYFAIKAHDEVPNIAPISNVITVANPTP